MTGMLVLEFPMPPSVNAIWRAKRSRSNGKPTFYLEPTYQRWIKECNAEIWAQGLPMTAGKLPLKGDVIVVVALDLSSRRGDADNRLKAVNDMLERSGIVANDRQIVKSTIFWGDAPKGCRIEISPATARAAA